MRVQYDTRCSIYRNTGFEQVDLRFIAVALV